MDCGMPGFPIPHYLWEFTQTYVHESVMPSNHLSLAPTSALNLSQHQGLFSELALPKWWPRYRSFRYSIRPSNKYTGLIPFRIDWFDLPAVQGTLESSPAPQSESVNSSVLSLLYGPTHMFVHDYWKNHRFYYMDLCQQSDIPAF